MSLINEALRKARQAASERAAQDSDTPFRGKRLHPARQSRSGSRLAVVVLVAAVAAVVGASAAWWAAGRQAIPEGSSEGTRQAAVLTGEGPSGESPPAAVSHPSADGAIEPLNSDAAAPTPPHSSAIQETPAPAQSESQPAQAEQPTSPKPVERAATPPLTETSSGDGGKIASPGGDRVFVLEADLGYATLSLDYIVFRPEDPFAEINGIEVHEGWFVEDFVVDKIERDRVILHDEKGPLILRVP